MDFEKGLISSIVRDGFEYFLEQEVNGKIFSSDCRRVIDYLGRYWRKFGKTPSFEVLAHHSGYDFSNEANAPIGHWLDHLKKKYQHSLILKASKEIYDDVTINGNPDNSIELIGKLNAEINSLENESSIICNMTDKDRYDRAMQKIWGGLNLVPTLWPQMDEKIGGGFRAGDLAVIAARPAVGKTMILLLMCIAAWKAGKRVLLASTEMTEEALRFRFIFLAGMYDSLGKLRRGMISNQTHEWIKTQMESCEKTGEAERFKVLSSNGSLNTQLETIEAKIAIFKPDLLAIDGAYLLRSNAIKEQDRFRRIAEIYDRLKAVSKKNELATVTTTQLNRGNQKGGKASKVDLERLAFADNVGMVADYVFFATQSDELKTQKKIAIEPGKLREGHDYEDLILNWDFEGQNFTEVPKITKEMVANFEAYSNELKKKFGKSEDSIQKSAPQKTNSRIKSNKGFMDSLPPED